MFIFVSRYDNFTHRVGDIDSLEDLIYGLTDNMCTAKRMICVAKYMNIGDIFVTEGNVLTYGEDT